MNHPFIFTPTETHLLGLYVHFTHLYIFSPVAMLSAFLSAVPQPQEGDWEGGGVVLTARKVRRRRPYEKTITDSGTPKQKQKRNIT